MYGSKLDDPRFLLDLLTLLVVEIFIISRINPEYLLTNTITTGGDTASHYYTLQYLREVLLPAGQVSGWTPGNYAGFPILQFYFPLDFLLMTLASGITSLQVAFKLGSVAGMLFLPLCAYGMLRLMRCPFPGPGIAAVLTLPFLFNTSHSMWGGNILSSFAGEFSYSLSMALSLVLLGSLYDGVRRHRRVVRNAILVFLVGFSHGYTLLFAEAMSLYLLTTPRGFVERLFYLGKVYSLAFCLLAFWLVPLLVFTKVYNVLRPGLDNKFPAGSGSTNSASRLSGGGFGQFGSAGLGCSRSRAHRQGSIAHAGLSVVWPGNVCGLLMLWPPGLAWWISAMCPMGT